MDRGEFGVDAGRVFADDRELDTEGGLAVPAELAVPAVDARGDRDAVAGLEPRDVLADRLDDARGVAAGNVGHLQVQSRQPATGPDVEVVERPGLDVDEHLARPGFGVRDRPVLDDIGTAVADVFDCLHTRPVASPPQNDGGSPPSVAPRVRRPVACVSETPSAGTFL